MKSCSAEFPIKKMAKVFNVSRSGYYECVNKKQSKRSQKNDELFRKIKLIFAQSRENYGSPRVHAVLKKQGEHCSRKRIAKIMSQNNLQAKTRKKWKPTSATTRDTSRIAPNLLSQNFKVAKANTVWVLDITYIKTEEGWLYVSAVLDLYSRKVVGLSMGNCMNTELVIRSLKQAVCHRVPAHGLILHSDRGTQYTSNEYQTFAEQHGFIVSMSAQGNCYDNAVVESFFHTLKTEHVFFHKFVTRNEAMRSIFEYVEVFYNRQRLHSTLKFMSPHLFEQQLEPSLEEIQQESRVKSPLPAIEADNFVFSL